MLNSLRYPWWCSRCTCVTCINSTYRSLFEASMSIYFGNKFFFLITEASLLWMILSQSTTWFNFCWELRSRLRYCFDSSFWNRGNSKTRGGEMEQSWIIYHCVIEKCHDEQYTGVFYMIFRLYLREASSHTQQPRKRKVVLHSSSKRASNLQTNNANSFGQGYISITKRK